MTDSELLDRIRAGEARLQAELYRRYEPLVRRKCRLMVKDREVARDLTQDIFVKITTRLHQFRGESELSFWIYSITYNHCVSHLKKAKRLRFEPVDAGADVADEGDGELARKVIADLAVERLERLIDGLPADERVVVLLRYREGRSVRVVAEMLGLGESAVKMRLQRARRRLAKLLGPPAESD